MPVDDQRLLDDVLHAHARVERRVRILEDDLHVAPRRAQPLLREREDVFVRETAPRRTSARSAAGCTGRSSSCRCPIRRPGRTFRPRRCRSVTSSTARTAVRLAEDALLPGELLREMADLEQRRHRAASVGFDRGCRAGSTSTVRGVRCCAAVKTPVSPRGRDVCRDARSHTARTGAGSAARTSSPAAAAPSGGTVPWIARSRVPGAPPGIEASRPRVYGCFGSANSARTGACSTIRPAYMTATRSAISATTPRSCVISSSAEAEPLLQLAQQLEDLRLDRDVERGRRLVGDQRASARTRAPSR